MFDPFQKFLPNAAAEYNFTRQLQAVKICQEFRSLSKDLLPPATQAAPHHYKNATLTVGVPDSVSAQQVAMQKHLIIDAINQKFGPRTLKNLKIEISAANSNAQTDPQS